MSDSLQPHGLQHARPLSITNSWSLPKLMSIKSVMPSNHLILCCPLLLLPSIFPSIRVFSNESVLCIRWPKYWSFSFSISPSSEHQGLISFRMDWLDLLEVQGTLKSLLQQTLQFKSINSLALSLLHSPTLTSLHDYWKNRSLDLVSSRTMIETRSDLFKSLLTTMLCGISRFLPTSQSMSKYHVTFFTFT